MKLSYGHASNDMLLYLVLIGGAFVPAQSTDKVVFGVLLVFISF